MIGAVVSNKSKRRINAGGRLLLTPSPGAELVAILVALQEMKDARSHETIATDSQASMFMIHKHLYEPHKQAENKHKAILQKIVSSCSKEQQQDSSQGHVSYWDSRN